MGMAGFCISTALTAREVVLSASSSLQKLAACFCSSSGSRSGSSSRKSSGDCGESEIYRHKLKFQRPTTIKWKDHLCNSVSFTGSLLFPVKVTMSSNRFGVHTLLQVQPSSSSPHSFKILLMMWDQMAKMSSQHLKQDDLVSVSGRLGSYTKLDAKGIPRLFYKVTVGDLNFVTGRFQSNMKSDQTEPMGVTTPTSGAGELQKETDHLYLWQVFFTNPSEWWDNRTSKFNPRAPDFKHKDTGECLWLNSGDPPWVRTQLKLLDSRMAEQRHVALVDSQSDMSMWKYEE